MKSRPGIELAVMGVCAVAALGLILATFVHTRNGSVLFAVVVPVAIVACAQTAIRARVARPAVTETGPYRQLADEYRRLADLAITAQEHTDLKLGDVGVRIDYLREQMESLQTILKEVE